MHPMHLTTTHSLHLRGLMTGLAGEGYKCLAVDMLDHGASEKVQISLFCQSMHALPACVLAMDCRSFLQARIAHDDWMVHAAW